MLRVALGNADHLPSPLTADEWRCVYDMSRRQGILGIMYGGVEQLPLAERPSADICDEWMVLTKYITQRNQLLNQYAVRICQTFRAHGFRCCILKGQGCATWYPSPQLRQPGDIDVWVDGEPDDIIRYVQQNMRNVDAPGYQHIGVEMKNGVHMEVHYRPITAHNPLYNRRLQRWTRELTSQQWDTVAEMPEGRINIPTPRFNSSFLLLHFIHHFIFEGAGFKQILDIYWLTMRGDFCMDDAKRLRLMPMLRALSWVFLQMGMPADRLPCQPDEKLGRLFLDDIMETGIISADELSRGRFSQMSNSTKFFRRLARGRRLFRLCPQEWFWEPFTNVFSKLLT